MKKILLIGELNETLHSLNECMSDSFKVQMCSINEKDIKDMIRIIRPVILVINVYDVSDNTTMVFDMLKKKYGHMPLVVIGIADIEEKFKEMLTGFSRALFLARPILANDVLAACKGLLYEDGEEQLPVIGQGQNSNTVNSDNKRRILVVDDNALMLRKVKKMLEDDYDVSIVNSGEKALKLLVSNPPELVLLDYDMPGINGKDTYERMKENEVTKAIPVIFLTSVAQRKQAVDILKSQPAGYILKPPVKEKILSAIREVLG